MDELSSLFLIILGFKFARKPYSRENSSGTQINSRGRSGIFL